MARVMLIEDDRHVRRSVMAMFREVADIVAFETLGDAQLHVEETWDGMIVDHRLPDGDGLVFAIGVKQAQPAMNIVLFTASEPHEVAARTNEHGIVYAHKTDGIAILRRVVSSWVRTAATKAPPPMVGGDEESADEASPQADAENG